MDGVPASGGLLIGRGGVFVVLDDNLLLGSVVDGVGGGVDDVRLARGCGPGGGAVGGSLDGPVGFVFEVVVAAAQALQVRLVGLSAVGPGEDVVEFAAEDRAVAGGEAAGAIAGHDE